MYNVLYICMLRRWLPSKLNYVRVWRVCRYLFPLLRPELALVFLEEERVMQQ